jgi:hypothetical protein
MRVQMASYAPVPDRPAHNITTEPKSKPLTVRVRLDADITEDQDLAQLEFRLRIIPGVANISIEGRNIIVTYKIDHSWPRICLRICDRLVQELGWSYHNTKIDGAQPNWFDRSGASMH